MNPGKSVILRAAVISVHCRSQSVPSYQPLLPTKMSHKVALKVQLILWHGHISCGFLYKTCKLFSEGIMAEESFCKGHPCVLASVWLWICASVLWFSLEVLSVRCLTCSHVLTQQVVGPFECFASFLFSNLKKITQVGRELSELILIFYREKSAILHVFLLLLPSVCEAGQEFEAWDLLTNNDVTVSFKGSSCWKGICGRAGTQSKASIITWTKRHLSVYLMICQLSQAWFLANRAFKDEVCIWHIVQMNCSGRIHFQQWHETWDEV